MTHYRTKDGDMLDAICHNHYGASAYYVEAVLDANPHLTKQTPLLPAGILITLPDLPKLKALLHTVRLWD